MDTQPIQWFFLFAMLASFQNNTGNFNGDLSHLISYQASGIAADSLQSKSNVDNQCFHQLILNNNVPLFVHDYGCYARDGTPDWIKTHPCMCLEWQQYSY